MPNEKSRQSLMSLLTDITVAHVSCWEQEPLSGGHAADLMRGGGRPRRGGGWARMGMAQFPHA